MPVEKEEKLEEMGFFDHLEDLRSTIISLLGAWFAVSVVLSFLSGYILEFLLAGIPVESLYFHAPLEAFMVRLKLSFIAGFLVTFPYLLFRVWAFISPGLFSREKRVILPLIIPATVLFYAGAAFAYWVMIPVVMKFLMAFGTEKLSPLISVERYFEFVARLCVAFGLVFQLPIVIVSLTALGVISPSALLRQWRWVILLIFIVAAVLTPPDPASQIIMAVPLVVLFLVSATLSIIIERKRKRGNKAGPGVS